MKIVIHAGAGNVQVTDKNRLLIEHRLTLLKEIVAAGYRSLQKGIAALDVVQQAVVALEDCEEFNAGRGSVLTSEGSAEMDASIMDGRNCNAGAVAVVKRVKNPVVGARAVMDKSPHVLLAGEGADKFCQKHGVSLADKEYFITPYRQQELQKIKSQGVQDLDVLGTVGAVAYDQQGNLAAATSTGGKANKMPGRVGDSPIVGGGVWADNNTCAVSATGDGEIFMRACFAHTIHAYLSHGHSSLKNVCEYALQQVAKFQGKGGCIALDKQGKLTIAFNTLGMYRAWIDDTGKAHAKV